MDDQMITLRKALMFIVEDIKRVCEQNDINFFLDCGSLLGAVRHKGFIPWDDDMDIGMLKEDYERFVKIAPKELSSCMYLDEMHNNDKCSITYAKVRLLGTKYIEKKGNKEGEHNEIFVDVFPYFSWPETPKIKNRIESAILSLACHSISAKMGMCVWEGDNFAKKIRFMPTRIVGAICSLGFLRRIVMHYFNKYKSDEYTLLNGLRSSFVTYFIPKSYLEEITYTQFDGHLFPIPKYAHEILTLGYGNYMVLPPEEERHTHEIQELDFGNYSF